MSTGTAITLAAALTLAAGMNAQAAELRILVSADEINKKPGFGDGGPIALIVFKGEAELGMQPIPELLAQREVNFVGPLPAAQAIIKAKGLEPA